VKGRLIPYMVFRLRTFAAKSGPDDAAITRDSRSAKSTFTGLSDPAAALTRRSGQ